ncbi:putative Transposable element Tc1 transposase-like 40 [Homarus americanus]|uniref:Putative Transposable element Tc1 transposase-like 40 n=1 Tax=Homarus americanus TaxID=6706 RepID=A0A8J5MMQ3_HOMAM|nr:putative Transposable element Tc1 transposase-like 40 [Homarus americanus]
MDRQQTRLILRGQIIALRNNGLCIRVIAHQRTLSRVTTPQEDEHIRQAVEENPFTNAVAIRDELLLNVSSEETVRRRLHEAGIHHRVFASRERLTDQHRATRLAFARQYTGEGCYHNYGFYGTSKKLAADRILSSKEVSDLLASCSTELPAPKVVLDDLEKLVIRYIYCDAKNTTLGEVG